MSVSSRPTASQDSSDSGLEFKRAGPSFGTETFLLEKGDIQSATFKPFESPHFGATNKFKSTLANTAAGALSRKSPNP